MTESYANLNDETSEGSEISLDSDQQEKDKIREHVTVVVLGDLGHSPRMNYHALSLSHEGFEVNLVGYKGSNPLVEILEDQHITLTYMKKCPEWFHSCPKIICLMLKAWWQSVVLFFTLLLSSRPSKLLVQNPPSVPALPVCWMYCLIMRCKFFIDWHNYGFSLMAMSTRKNHPIVRIYKAFEKIFGKLAHAGFCVTQRMQDDLAKNWGIHNVAVHYDRPHSRFHPISPEEKHNLYLKVASDYQSFACSSPDKTVFTERFADGRVSFYEDRPALVVSSTSWTEDEDFSILLHSLQDFENVRNRFPEHYPKLIVVITGKGPLRSFYMDDIQSRNWQHVIVIAPWLSAEDYPRLLASADVGISLHYSSSGLDLPMKVVDMFGSGLPVMAISYPAISELVVHNENGLIFSSKEELANLLQDWFRGFPKETVVKETYYNFYANISKFREMSWHSEWTKSVLPFFRDLHLK